MIYLIYTVYVAASWTNVGKVSYQQTAEFINARPCFFIQVTTVKAVGNGGLSVCRLVYIFGLAVDWLQWSRGLLHLTQPRGWQLAEWNVLTSNALIAIKFDLHVPPQDESWPHIIHLVKSGRFQFFGSWSNTCTDPQCTLRGWGGAGGEGGGGGNTVVSFLASLLHL